MSTYMQMGHDTENLVGEKDLNYDGLILSPLNRLPNAIIKNTLKFRKIGEYDIIFDTQLYFPETTREKIKKYPYFPSDIETADQSSFKWWETIIDNLCPFLDQLEPDAVTSPVVVPKKFSDAYYKMSIDVGNHLYNVLASNKSNYRPIQSIIICIEQIESEEDVLKLASMISGSFCNEIYLIFTSPIAPRLEFRDSTQILNILKLVNLLECAGKKTIISFCSSDMLLYKAAGASACATGKFFNLRRFTSSRFEESSGGGGQLPYLFEEGLFAFLRQADIIRILGHDCSSLLQTGNSKNNWSDEIFNHLKKSPAKAWVASGWRQYLAWFSSAEKQYSSYSTSEISSLLKTADNNWGILDDKNIYLDERKNNGEWIRAWLQAISDFSSFV